MQGIYVVLCLPSEARGSVLGRSLSTSFANSPFGIGLQPQFCVCWLCHAIRSSVVAFLGIVFALCHSRFIVPPGQLVSTTHTGYPYKMNGLRVNAHEADDDGWFH